MAHPTHVGPYPILGEIARGGQGVVFLAQHPNLKHRVAVKVLTDPEPENVQRFKQEARVLAHIRHPNLLQVMDFGLAGEFPYMVMEYIDGWDLKNFLQQSQLETTQLLEIIRIVAGALAYLHSRGLVHRDIKPGNILIERGSLRPVLADLGLVKRDPKMLSIGSVESKMSHTGEIMGTPAYMAPEQVDASMGSIGPWTDVYALGATLYQIMTGQQVYSGAGYSIYTKLMDDTPVPHPKSLNPNIPDYIANAIFAAIQKRPENRPQTMEEWAGLLQPPKPKPPSSGRHKALPRRRRWAPVVVGTLGFGSLVAYFLSMGASPKEAKQLAREEISTPHSALPTNFAPPPSPPPASITSVVSAPSTLPRTSPIPIRRIPIADPQFDSDARRALILCRDGAYPESISLCTSLIEEFPEADVVYWTRANAYYRLAAQLMRQGQSEEGRVALRNCIRDTNKAISLSPETEKPETIEIMRQLKAEAESKLEESRKKRCHRHRRY